MATFPTFSGADEESKSIYERGVIELNLVAVTNLSY